MSKVLIIGAGGVGTVVAHKVAADSAFTDIMLASRTKSKCDETFAPGLLGKIGIAHTGLRLAGKRGQQVLLGQGSFYTFHTDVFLG